MCLTFPFWLLCIYVHSTHFLEEQQIARIQEGSLMQGDGASEFSTLFFFLFLLTFEWRHCSPTVYQTDTSSCVTAWCDVAQPMRYFRLKFYFSVLIAATQPQRRLLLVFLLAWLSWCHTSTWVLNNTSRAKVTSLWWHFQYPLFPLNATWLHWCLYGSSRSFILKNNRKTINVCFFPIPYCS